MASSDYFGSTLASRANRSPLPSALPGREGTPGSPHTPNLGRTLSSQFGSPGSYRSEEEAVIYEIGSRFLRAGFAGESAPRCIFRFSPQNSERAGDVSRWTHAESRRSRAGKRDASKEWELWCLDVRSLDLGLVEDQLERALREIHNTYFLLDLKPRKAYLTVSPNASNPIVEIILRVLFRSHHQPASAILMSGAVLNTVAAGLRSALVVDIGWHETTITAVYEYREVLLRLSDRAGSALHAETLGILQEASKTATSHDQASRTIDFETIQDVMERLLWCRKSAKDQAGDNEDLGPPVTWIAPSNNPIDIPFARLAMPVENVLFESDSSMSQVDDNHRPIALLAWKCLLALPYDIRATCVSRIVVTGGVSAIPGLKPRLLAEIEALVHDRKWDPVMSYGSAKRAGESLQKLSGVSSHPQDLTNKPDGPADNVPPQPNSMADSSLTDEITEKLTRESTRGRHTPAKAKVRGVQTLGPWAGASMMASSKVEGTVEIKREEFLKHGIGSYGSVM